MRTRRPLTHRIKSTRPRWGAAVKAAVHPWTWGIVMSRVQQAARTRRPQEGVSAHPGPDDEQSPSTASATATRTPPGRLRDIAATPTAEPTKTARSSSAVIRRRLAYRPMTAKLATPPRIHKIPCAHPGRTRAMAKARASTSPQSRTATETRDVLTSQNITWRGPRPTCRSRSCWVPVGKSTPQVSGRFQRRLASATGVRGCPESTAATPPVPCTARRRPGDAATHGATVNASPAARIESTAHASIRSGAMRVQLPAWSGAWQRRKQVGQGRPWMGAKFIRSWVPPAVHAGHSPPSVPPTT
jgi:hypothetical protein